MPIPSFTTPNTNIDLTTLALVKRFNNIETANTKDDDVMQLCITAAGYEWLWRTSRLEPGELDPMKSPFVTPVELPEVYDGNGSARLFVRNWPIRSVQYLR